MSSTVATATFSGVDLTDAITSALEAAALPKRTANAIKKAATASLVKKLQAQTKAARVVRKSSFSLALETYKKNLNDIRGGARKGRPFTEHVESALNRLTSEELRALELGRSHRFRKEAPASMVVSNSELVSSLRH